MSTASFGIKLGRGIGKASAVAFEIAFVSATSAGRFGADFATGVETGYVETREQLVERRIAAAKKRSDDLAAALAAHKLAMEPAPVVVVPEPEPEPAPAPRTMKFAKRNSDVAAEAMAAKRNPKLA